ncbi:DUF4974 domain-containing protein [Polaribacter batillariae]|uniref:DUF4974 domain-containing protein n=1 Tax=Polaribacter batillariae TaxID=2808900 RepID=A0ABX7SQS0_9FLAO|nr:FecR domain-containing protein [Polaribacter batillariae]QTD36580.1 DUF4974 domain-containing protein [Polaribacter batillariae]
MNKKKAKKLFSKYINNECSGKEIRKLEVFLDSYQDKKNIWKEELADKKLFQANSWSKIQFQIKKEQSKQKHTFTTFFKYVAAASVLIVISLAFYFTKQDSQKQFLEPIIVNNQIEKGTDKAVLMLSNNKEVVLEKGKPFNDKNIISDGKELVYKKSDIKQIAYNTLTVPRGGEFQITLSDGTKVWLNSDTKIKYPEVFSNGKERQVELVYGEAYFDVSSSFLNNGTSFKVLSQSQEITVLGTEFNVKAYKEDSIIYTTLVEGSVAIDISGKNQVLKPGEQAALNLKNDNITILKNVDVYNEISWRQGVFSFENKPLANIMQTLSRWYNMQVTFDDKSLESLRFSGKLKKSQSIEDIMTAVKNSSIINNYEINNKTIFLR